MSILKEKIAICHLCVGETYRESALDKINNFYKDNDKYYYFILTDDKSYFKSVKRKNFYINEVKDFFKDYPLIETNEPLIYAKDKNEYAEIFTKTCYTLSFSLMRLHLLQALEHKIYNISMICTDTEFYTDRLECLPKEKNRIYNAASEWDEDISNHNMEIIAKYLKKKYNFKVSKKVRVLDAAARLFRFKNLKDIKQFFNVWNDVIEYLYKTKQINYYKGGYVVNDEYILAPIYNMFKLNLQHGHAIYPIFVPFHNVGKERFWRTLGSDGLKEHYNYKEFLKINKIKQ